MIVLVIGKRGSMTNWTEEALDGFASAGHSVQFCATRLSFLSKGIDRALWPYRLSQIKKRVEKTKPDLILAICPERMDQAILEDIASIRHRPPIAGWVGHAIAKHDVPTLNLCDGLGYTDTAYIEMHRELGLSPAAAYVPHAADLTLDPWRSHASKPQLVFVGGGCTYRRSILAPLDRPVALYGPAWKDRREVEQHDCVPQRVYRRNLGAVYSQYAGTLNFRNEGLVLRGLNQRHFTPAALGLLSVTDAQEDLPLCFEPGREVLVYETPAQIDEISKELLRSPTWAARIARRGQERVLAEHTYGKRLEALGTLVSAAQLECVPHGQAQGHSVIGHKRQVLQVSA